jgi:hypothetical protein
MKKLTTLLVIALITLLIGLTSCKKAEAFDIHDISGNYTLLVNLTNGKFFSAPSIDATLATAFNDIMKFDVKVAFPTSAGNGDTADKSILAGPWLGVSFTKLFAGHTKIKLMEGVNLGAGAGVLIAVSSIEGMDLTDWKAITFPGASIGISF